MSGLAGGSFSGTYTSTGFSDFVEFATYQVNLYNSSGALVYTIKPLPPPITEYGDGYFDPTIGGPGRGLLVFYDDIPGAISNLNLLQLVLPLPFNGSGSAIPYDPNSIYRSVLRYNKHLVRVASATLFAVPGPPSVVLLGISGMAGLGGIGLRRNRTAS